MLCLGIETSCDDTSLALVRDGKILAEAAAGQTELHALFGGVVPEVASREHARFVGPLFDRLLGESGVTIDAIDAVAVARGPGLLGSLLVGVAFAKTLALGTGARFIGVNHLHAHIFAAGIKEPLPLPALALLVSGGHTHLYRVDAPDAFTLIGRTLDDAAGEAFDKAGKMLGLPYPAGRHIDALAERGRADVALFPRPYLNNDNLDFSFSGLKTALYCHLEAHPASRVHGVLFKAGSDAIFPPEDESALADLCASYRLAVVDTLIAKTERALRLESMRGLRGLVLAGGVAANSLLRRQMAELAQRRGLLFSCPPPALCTDNGVMIAHLGCLLTMAGYGHDLGMEAVARGRAVPDDMRRFGP